MTTSFNGMFDQDSEAKPASDVASSSNSSIKKSRVRSCPNCVRAKAKCYSSVSIEGKCERCYRMNKDCQPPLRKRETVKRPAATKTSKLEEKLDGLVTPLKSVTQTALGIKNATPVGSPPEGAVPSSHEKASSSTAAGSVGYQDNTYSSRPLPDKNGCSDSDFTPATSSSSVPVTANSQPVLHPDLEPSPEDAESYLNKFRTDFVKHLPFIVIPPSMTAHQLRQERPILWVSIMSAASSNPTQQIGLSREVRVILGREAYVEGTRSMDLLLAVLVYVAWERHHCFEKTIFISLVQLAIAILYDLGLGKPPSKDPSLIYMYDLLKGTRKPSRLFRSPTMEERRALLGCFLMSSIACFHLRKGDAIRWTAYSDECLRVIETQKEFESDVLLVQLVKLRLIHEKVADIPWSNALTEGDRSMRTPVVFYLKSLEAQLLDFRSNIPNELTDNKTLLMELFTAELRVHEIGLSQAPGSFSGQYTWLLECLGACLNATKSTIDIFRSILPAQYVGFSAGVYANLTHCFIGIYRLSTLEHPEWDRRLVRENLDLSLFLEEAEKNFSQVKEVAGLKLGGSEDIDFFTAFASRIRVIRTWWDTTISTTASLGTAPIDVMGVFPMDFLDDSWLGDNWILE